MFRGGRENEEGGVREKRVRRGFMNKNIWKWAGKTLEKTSWWSRHFCIYTKTHFILFSFSTDRQPKFSNTIQLDIAMHKILVNKIMAEKMFAFLGLVHKSHWRVNFCAFCSCCLPGWRWPPWWPWKPKGKVGNERFKILPVFWLWWEWEIITLN